MKLKRTFVNVKYKDVIDGMYAEGSRRIDHERSEHEEDWQWACWRPRWRWPGVAMAQKETRGVSKTEIVLGMHTDLSGPAATYGVSSSNAVKMRFDEVNEKGGIHGRKIKLVVEDTQYQVPRAVQAGTKLINRDHIFAMVARRSAPR